jgi:hypothetical protein
MPGRILEAGFLFNMAVDAARNISAESRQEGQSAALVSVVFAVVSLEAFLNEATEVAQDVQQVKSEPETVAAFAQLMEESERLPLETKFKLSTWLLTGKRAGRRNVQYDPRTPERSSSPARPTPRTRARPGPWVQNP